MDTCVSAIRFAMIWGRFLDSCCESLLRTEVSIFYFCPCYQYTLVRRSLVPVNNLKQMAEQQLQRR